MCISLNTRNPQSIKHKPAYVIEVCRKDAILSILRVIQDKLKIKQAQAKLMIEFFESRGNAKHLGIGKGITPYTQRELEIVKEMKQLNHKGVQPPFAA